MSNLKILRRACEMSKPAGQQWVLVQNAETGLIVGNIGPNKDGAIHYAPDGVAYTLSPAALRAIADLIDTHGLELAS